MVQSVGQAVSHIVRKLKWSGREWLEDLCQGGPRVERVWEFAHRVHRCKIPMMLQRRGGIHVGGIGRVKDDDCRSGKILWIEVRPPTTGKWLGYEDIASVGSSPSA